MAVGYRVSNLRLASGERFPLLLDTVTGLPLWNPTLFVITELRSANKASATMAQATRAVMVGLQALEMLKVNLAERLDQGRLLEVHEVDSLASLAGLTQEALDSRLKEAKLESTKGSSPRVVSLEKARMNFSRVESEPQVEPLTKGIRLTYIRNYLAWLARRKVLSTDHRHPSHGALSDAAQHVFALLTERIPPDNGLNELTARQGLDVDVQRRIEAVVDPESPENPWKNKHVRARNQLIFLWLLKLGLRKSELLGVRLEDVNLRASEVTIVRRADDPDEIRADAPNTKTKARLLALGPQLAELTRAYVHGERKDNKLARRYPNLFVATGTGKPLSKAALGKLFVELRRKVPGLPKELSPHVLRHTWNERFSELMDERNVSPEEEERMRKQQMGWKDSSKMPAVYTRRHTRRKTNEASLALQAVALNPKGTKQ